MISVLQLGTLDYASSTRLQEKLVDLRKEDRIGDTLLLLEHPPVITLGRNAKSTNIIASPDQLSKRQVEIVECDRGGDVTFHGPGQIVGYPIFDLRGFSSSDGKRKTLGVIEYVRRLEEVLIRTCGDFGIGTKRICGLTGVWTTTDEAEAKIAAIGVHISRSVTSHGFALNVSPDLSFFDLIIPCGITSKPVTSMERVINKSISLFEVAESIVKNFNEVFQTQVSRIDSLEALFGARVGVPMTPPADLRKLHGAEETFLA